MSQATAGPAEPSFARGLTRAMLACLGIRMLVFAVAFCASATLPAGVQNIHASGIPLFAWDSFHYLTILRDGYPVPSQPLLDACFFPLFPLLAAPFTLVMQPELALLLVNNVCSLLGMGLAYAWLRSHLGHRTALISLVLLASYPPSMFYAAAYAEGITLLFLMLTLIQCERGRLWTSAFASGLASVSRATGIVAPLMLGLHALLRPPAGTWWRGTAARRIAILSALALVSLSGLIVFQGNLWHRYGRFDAYFVAQQSWADANTPSAAVALAETGATAPAAAATATTVTAGIAGRFTFPLNKLLSPGAWNKLLPFALLALGLAGLVWPCGLPRHVFLIPLVIFAIGYLPSHGARLNSIARFMTPCVPCFVVAGVLLRRSRALVWAAVVGQVALQCLFAWDFTRGSWAG